MAKDFPSTFMLHSDEGRKARCGSCNWSASDDDAQKVYQVASAHQAKHLIWEWPDKGIA